jgi:shikimate dehydrogenase
LFDLVVNASPLGMAGQPPLTFDFSHAPPGSTVYDIVTHPLETPLLLEAGHAAIRSLMAIVLIGAAVAFSWPSRSAPARRFECVSC